MDPIEFMLEYVMPHLAVKKKKDTVAVYPVCSVKKIGKTEQLLAQAPDKEGVFVRVPAILDRST